MAEQLIAVLMEAVKTLGPAAVAAFATYKATTAQYVHRLRELEHKHEFGAREHLFEYYKNRQEKSANAYAALSSTLGQFLGMATVISEDAEEIRSLSGLLDLYIRLAPFDIDVTLRDMQAKGVGAEEEIRKLSEYRDTVASMRPAAEQTNLSDPVFKILEVYGFLERCYQLLLERQLEGMFNKYMGKA